MVTKLRELIRKDGWIYLALPVFVTALLISFDSRLTAKRVVLIFAMNALISVAIGLSINGAYRILGPRLELQRRSPIARFFFHAIAVAAGVTVGTELALRAGALVSPELMEYFPRLAVLRIAIPISIVVVALSISWDRSKEKAKSELLLARLEALQARTNPHFLFNSLNTVAALIAEDPQRAERAVERLASLFRYSLEGSRTPRVELQVELEAVESYLELERLRFGDRLVAELEIDERARRSKVPPLVLQPLVENAIHHGVASKRGPGRVEIRARAENGTLILEVEDDGPGPGRSEKTSGSGTAQADLEARLSINYGGKAKLIRGPGRSGYLARVELPLEET